MILEAFLFISRPINCLNDPRFVMDNALLKIDFMFLNIADEPPIMSKSSTYNVINSKKPPFCYM